MLSNHPNVLGGGSTSSGGGEPGIFTKVLVGDGTAAAPSYSFISDTTKGFYSSGTNLIGVAVGGVKQFEFSTGGTLYGAQGNNTLSLPVAGSVALTAGGTNQSITLTPSGTGSVISLSGMVITGPTVSANTAASINLQYASPGGVVFARGPDASTNAALTLASTRSDGSNVVNFARFAPSGNTLLGGLTTDGTGVLQFPAATTSAGGTTYGTDTSYYRVSAGSMALDHVGGAAPTLLFYENGVSKARIGTNSGQLFINTPSNIVLQSGSSTSLTLDSSQNATFAGSVRAGNFATVSAPPYAKGVIYFDTTLNKLRVGGASAFETITSA